MNRMGRNAVVLAAGLLAAGRADVAESAARCSLLPPFASRMSRYVYFTGTATGDTANAGEYGQVVKVDRLLAYAAEATVLGGAVNATEAVLVPRSYDETCRPIPWTQNALWVTPGTTGMFYGTVRDPSRWAGGRPTFDVMGTHFSPYPHGTVRFPYGPAPDSTSLTADELYDVFAVVPDPADSAADPIERLAPLRTWVVANPELARRNPAHSLVRGQLQAPERRRVLSVEAPVAGLYRFVLQTAAGHSTEFYVRTGLNPTSVLWSPSGAQPVFEPPELPRAAAYYLVANAGRTPDLPVVRPALPGRGEIQTQSYFAMSLEPRVANADSTVWSGSVDFARIAAQLSGDASVAAGVAAGDAEGAVLRRVGRLTYVPGTFVKYTDGRVRYEFELRDGARLYYSIRGERISEVPMREPSR